MFTTVCLFVAFIVFVIAAAITGPTWNRLLAGGLAFLAAGLGALKLLGLG